MNMDNNNNSAGGPPGGTPQNGYGQQVAPDLGVYHPTGGNPPGSPIQAPPPIGHYNLGYHWQGFSPTSPATSIPVQNMYGQHVGHDMGVYPPTWGNPPGSPIQAPPPIGHYNSGYHRQGLPPTSPATPICVPRGSTGRQSNLNRNAKAFVPSSTSATSSIAATGKDPAGPETAEVQPAAGKKPTSSIKKKKKKAGAKSTAATSSIAATGKDPAGPETAAVEPSTRARPRATGKKATSSIKKKKEKKKVFENPEEEKLFLEQLAKEKKQREEAYAKALAEALAEGESQLQEADAVAANVARERERQESEVEQVRSRFVQDRERQESEVEQVRSGFVQDRERQESEVEQVRSGFVQDRERQESEVEQVRSRFVQDRERQESHELELRQGVGTAVANDRDERDASFLHVGLNVLDERDQDNQNAELKRQNVLATTHNERVANAKTTCDNLSNIQREFSDKIDGLGRQHRDESLANISVAQAGRDENAAVKFDLLQKLTPRGDRSAGRGHGRDYTLPLAVLAPAASGGALGLLSPLGSRSTEQSNPRLRPSLGSDPNENQGHEPLPDAARHLFPANNQVSPPAAPMGRSPFKRSRAIAFGRGSDDADRSTPLKRVKCYSKTKAKKVPLPQDVSGRLADAARRFTVELGRKLTPELKFFDCVVFPVQNCIFCIRKCIIEGKSLSREGLHEVPDKVQKMNQLVEKVRFIPEEEKDALESIIQDSGKKFATGVRENSRISTWTLVNGRVNGGELNYRVNIKEDVIHWIKFLILDPLADDIGKPLHDLVMEITRTTVDLWKATAGTNRMPVRGRYAFDDRI